MADRMTELRSKVADLVEERDLLVRQLTAIRAILDGQHHLERQLAGLGSSRRAQAPQLIPAEHELALLRQINAEEGLDVAEDELLDHARTQGYRQAIRAAYAIGQAMTLGYAVTADELGGVAIGDRLPAPVELRERPVDLVDRAAGRR
jgi:hypothetical protein